MFIFFYLYLFTVCKALGRNTCLIMQAPANISGSVPTLQAMGHWSVEASLRVFGEGLELGANRLQGLIWGPC